MIGRILRSGVAAALLLIATAGAPNPAQATSFAPLSIEQFTDASTWIVEGKVARVWTELVAEKGLVWTHAELQLSEVHKGPGRPETLVVSSIGGTHGDIRVHVPGQAVFSEGEEVFLFLDVLGGGQVVPVSKFQGKFTLRRAAGERRVYGMNWHASRTEQFDHRFLPHPAPQRRAYLDDLRERVASRLDVGWDGRPIPGMTAERLQTVNALERRLPR